MEKKQKKSLAQLLFLRKCHQDPFGLSHDDWPNPTVFRRWMRKPGFRVAVQGVRDALRFQADLHLAAAAAAAAKSMASVMTSDQPLSGRENLKDAKDQVQALMQLLRLAHLRQRFSMDVPVPAGGVTLTKDERTKINELRAMI